MDYRQCLAYLERLGNEVLTMKFGLDTIHRLLQVVGDPHGCFDSVLVAGTNGKGSVSRFLASVLECAGVRVGLFTSPHLVRLTERVRIQGAEVNPEVFARAFATVVEAVPKLGIPVHPTFFEMVTAAAFLCFAEAGVRLAVLEIGMGGRLDSTNVVDPLLSVLTPIDWDHQQYLGNTLEAIAGEKAGIMRSGKPALSSRQRPEVAGTLAAWARAKQSRLEFVETEAAQVLGSQNGCYRFQWQGSEYELSVCGRFQVENAVLALRAVDELKAVGLAVPDCAMQEGLRRALSPGVVQRIRTEPTVILDGGHNPAAAKSLAEFIREHTGSPRGLVFTMMKDKEIDVVLGQLESLFDRIHLVQLSSPRAAPLSRLAEFCPRGRPFADPGAAYQAALVDSSTIVVTGSFFLVGAVLEHLGC